MWQFFSSRIQYGLKDTQSNLQSLEFCSNNWRFVQQSQSFYGSLCFRQYSLHLIVHPSSRTLPPDRSSPLQTSLLLFRHHGVLSDKYAPRKQSPEPLRLLLAFSCSPAVPLHPLVQLQFQYSGRYLLVLTIISSTSTEISFFEIPCPRTSGSSKAKIPSLRL